MFHQHFYKNCLKVKPTLLNISQYKWRSSQHGESGNKKSQKIKYWLFGRSVHSIRSPYRLLGLRHRTLTLTHRYIKGLSINTPQIASNVLFNYGAIYEARVKAEAGAPVYFYLGTYWDKEHTYKDLPVRGKPVVSFNS